MNPFDYGKSFGDFWTAQGQAFLKMQEQAGQAMKDGMQAMASGTMPGMPTDLSTGATDLAQAGQSVMALWSAAGALSEEMVRTLSAHAQGAGTEPAAAGAAVDAAFRKIADPRSWMTGPGDVDDMLGHMAEGPRFADLWAVERLYAQVLQAWMTVRRSALEHNAVVLEAWLKAGRSYTEEIAGRSAAEAKSPDVKAALALWTDTANRQLLETQRSEPFLKTQTAMIRANTDLRLAQQALVEHFGKQYGFPTRTELDDVHRTVTELRRELRVLRRESRTEPRAQPQTAPAQSRPPVTRRPAAQKKAAR